jgi:hypothetical protein
VDERSTAEEGAQRIDAEGANRLAQEINDEAEGRAPTGAPSEIETSEREGAGLGPSPENTAAGYNPLQAEEGEGSAHLFPPNVAPDVELGGSAEERAALQEEFKH